MRMSMRISSQIVNNSEFCGKFVRVVCHTPSKFNKPDRNYLRFNKISHLNVIDTKTCVLFDINNRFFLLMFNDIYNDVD